MAVERIEWVDSVGESGWRRLSQLRETHDEMGRKLIVSIGQVVVETDVAVTICLSTGGVTDEYAECMTIPTSAIRTRQRLRVKGGA